MYRLRRLCASASLREQELEGKHEANIFEVGLRRQLTPRTLLVASLGFRVGDESPDLRAVLGAQRSL